MNKFSKHIPDFVDVDRNKNSTEEFETIEELLSLEGVRRYGKDVSSYFAMADNCLMEISDNGFYWWVIGYIKNPELVNLPKWEGWKFRAELSNGEKVILNDGEVSVAYDNVLILTDGTKARKL